MDTSDAPPEDVVPDPAGRCRPDCRWRWPSSRWQRRRGRSTRPPRRPRRRRCRCCGRCPTETTRCTCWVRSTCSRATTIRCRPTSTRPSPRPTSWCSKCRRSRCSIRPWRRNSWRPPATPMAARSARFCRRHCARSSTASWPQRGASIAQFDGYEPWFVNLSLMLGMSQQLGFSPEKGLDQHLMQRAAAARQADRGPGVDRHADAGARLRRRWTEQIVSLKEFLDKPMEMPGMLGDLHSAWRDGDVARLDKLTREEMREKTPQTYRIDQRRTQPGVVAADPGHARRREEGRHPGRGRRAAPARRGRRRRECCASKGYKVERVCSACTASDDGAAEAQVAVRAGAASAATAHGAGGNSTMQSTGHAGTHSSQPVHSGSITVCMCLDRADDRVHRAGLDALGAADAVGFDDHGDLRRLVLAARAVIGLGRDAEQSRERARTGVAAGRAAIDVRLRRGHRFGIRAGSRRNRTGRIGSAAACGRGVRSGRHGSCRCLLERAARQPSAARA